MPSPSSELSFPIMTCTDMLQKRHAQSTSPSLPLIFLGVAKEHLEFGEACQKAHRPARKWKWPTQLGSTWETPHLSAPSLRT